MRRRRLFLDRWWEARFLAVIAVYVLLAIWGDELAITRALTLWYPQAGFGVAAVALWGSRFVPALIAGELIATAVLVDVEGGLTATVIGATAVLVGGSYALVGLAIRRLGVDPALPDFSNVVRLLVILAIGAVPGAVARTTILRAADLLTVDHLDALAVRLEADLIGMLSITPALILAVSVRRSDRLEPRPRLRSVSGVAELALVLIVPVAVAAGFDRSDLLFLCPIVVVAIALRRAQPGASVAAAVSVSGVATTLRVTGDEFLRRDILSLLAVVALTGLLTGLVATRRFRATRTSDRLVDALGRSHDIVATISLSGDPRWWNRAGARFMIDPGTRTPRRIDEVLLGGADFAAQLAARVSAGRLWEGEHVIVAADDSEVHVSLVAVPDVDEQGAPSGYTIFARDITSSLADRAGLAHHALHDELTGVANRALLVEQLHHAAGRLHASRTQTVLILMNIDRFAVVNETLERAAGDELLRAVASRLKAQLRPGDVLARLEGDEFAIIVEGLSGRAAIDAAVDSAMETLRVPFVLTSGTVVATASLGIVRIDADDSPEEVLRRADLAMYRAKSEGGGRAAVYDDRVTTSGDRRLQIESTLRRTLTGADVPLEYQPVVDLGTGAIVFAEALLRLEHADLGPIPATEAVAVAQASGLLDELGLMTARTAAMEAASFPTSVGVSVNLAPSQLADEDLPHLLGQVLIEAGLEPSRMIIEVTEEAYLADPTATTVAIQRCRQTGVRVALDGFGRGWSTLDALRELPVDILKLDQRLLRGLGSSPPTRAIVGAVLGIAEVLELTVVAQGIDSEETLEIPRTLGCQLGQGHRIARPVERDGLDAWFGFLSRA